MEVNLETGVMVAGILNEIFFCPVEEEVLMDNSAIFRSNVLKYILDK